MRPCFQNKFHRVEETLEQSILNTSMGSARELVEWSYKDAKQQFTTVDFARTLMVRKAPIELKHKINVLLSNIKLYLHGSGEMESNFKRYSWSLEQNLLPMNGN